MSNKHPYKSKLELKISAILTDPELKYEKAKIPYKVIHNYFPDFEIGPNKYIEGKGRFQASDRAKHLYIKEQHPEVKIYFVFGNPDNKLNKLSKTSYGDWATKHGFEWCSIQDFNKQILKKWIKQT